MRYFVTYNDDNEVVSTIKSVPDIKYDGYMEVLEEEYNVAIEEWKDKRPVTASELQSMLEEVL